jgi:hypothetical protein
MERGGRDKRLRRKTDEAKNSDGHGGWFRNERRPEDAED